MQRISCFKTAVFQKEQIENVGLKLAPVTLGLLCFSIRKKDLLNIVGQGMILDLWIKPQAKLQSQLGLAVCNLDTFSPCVLAPSLHPKRHIKVKFNFILEASNTRTTQRLQKSDTMPGKHQSIVELFSYKTKFSDIIGQCSRLIRVGSHGDHCCEVGSRR